MEHWPIYFFVVYCLRIHYNINVAQKRTRTRKCIQQALSHNRNALLLEPKICNTYTWCSTKFCTCGSSGLRRCVLGLISCLLFRPRSACAGFGWAPCVGGIYFRFKQWSFRLWVGACAVHFLGLVSFSHYIYTVMYLFQLPCFSVLFHSLRNFIYYFWKAFSSLRMLISFAQKVIKKLCWLQVVFMVLMEDIFEK